VPVLRSIDERLREAATVLGASPSRVWREIDLPIVRRAVLVAAGFAFAISLGEFGATLFIARPDRPTMPVAIFRYLSQAGAANFGAAMAMSTLLMLITATAIFTIERFRTPGLGEF
jgi:thiamine transport system permease protein